MSQESWTIGIDVGGTFIDLVAQDRFSGRRVRSKHPSTPDDPAEGIIAGIAALLDGAGISSASVQRIAHGTTVGTNALIERSGAPVALLTTEGFRDLLEIGRQVRPSMYDLEADAPDPLVPRARRFEVRERITRGGTVVAALDDGEVARVVEQLASLPAESAIAVCFLSFLNPEHELRIGAALEGAGRRYVSLSHDVSPEFREYERLSTTVMNAYLQPVVTRYLRDLGVVFAKQMPSASLHISQSSGGLMTFQQAQRQPVRTALSGPAAGVTAVVKLIDAHGLGDVVTLDVGGTSADVALLRGGRARIAREREVAGFPMRVPAIDMHTIGAGGGSVAWIDRDGLMKVGPQSTGANPGPACYGMGGSHPTVTDANLLLGRLPVHGLLGGRLPLNADLAKAVIAGLAERLGLTLMRTAHGIVEIVVANMIAAIRRISVERGFDPRGCCLVAFGGAGPLHASQVARGLNIGRILVPRQPGLLCAEGLLASPHMEVFTRSCRLLVDGSYQVELGRIAEELRSKAVAWAQNFDGTPVLHFEVDMRYVGQNHEVVVEAGNTQSLEKADLRGEFLSAHDRAYGYEGTGGAVEIMTIRLVASVLAHDRSSAPIDGTGGGAAAQGKRAVMFAADCITEVPCYQRHTLSPRSRIEGPAIVDQFDSTIVVWPGDHGNVLDDGSLLLSITEKGA